jgi:uncharacterized lipoprotein YddW (UPF0748 family)
MYLSTQQQQEEIIAFLDLLVDLKMHVVFFQVRPEGDAFYQSSYEPWSHYLTSVQGQPPNPFYDPLEFVINEAHARGIQIHAWFNPYRAAFHRSNTTRTPTHMCNLFPSYCYEYGATFLWMDPGAEVVSNFTYDVIMDVVARYAI